MSEITDEEAVAVVMAFEMMAGSGPDRSAIEWQSGQVITVPVSSGDEIGYVPVMGVTVAVGTGLCYHLSIGDYEDGHYVVAQANSGYNMPGTVKTEAQARTWIELTRDVVDWNQPVQAIMTIGIK